MKYSIAVVALVLFAGSLFAADASGDAPVAKGVSLKNPTTNLVQDPGDAGGDGGGSYSYCIARSSQGQKCRDVVTIYIPNTICAGGCNRCASVKFSASCSCNNDTLAKTGSCTYW